MGRPKTSKKGQYIALGVTLGVLAIGCGIFAAGVKNNLFLTSETTVPDIAPAATSVVATLPTSGEIQYEYNDAITTILFMGIDDYEGYESTQIFGNGGRADTIILFIFNEETNTISPFLINRDLYTPVDAYDDDRNFLYSGDMQLCMQYTFSDNDTRGCLLMKEKVSQILYGTPIDYYCSLNIDGMSAFINAIGGLTVTFEEDYSYIDPAFTLGATVTMNAEQAEDFYRYRDINEVGSNQGRMERQAWLMQKTFEALAGSSQADVDNILEALDGYLTTDMSADAIYSIRGASLGEAYTTPGEYGTGTVHDAFYMDENALTDMLFDIFYVEVEN